MDGKKENKALCYSTKWIQIESKQFFCCSNYKIKCAYLDNKTESFHWWKIELSIAF